ncbi:YdcF family protein [Nakamurella endophytica]|uniref:YdcF family protein n=1 Tax=Nakamurella endophytica TaxID=1748367 RepID=UPI001668C0CC|nr:YdcF family protein [Nakamurella endophytica]
MQRRPAVRAARGLGRYLAGALVVLALAVGGLAVRVVQAGHLQQLDPADAIVVLGAAQYDGRPSDVYAARLDHAAALQRAGVASRIVTVGGGRAGDRVTEGEAGRRYLAGAGVDPADLLAVGIGGDTLVSLRAAAQQLRARGWTRVVLVTDPWHIQRSRTIAADLGLTVRSAPVTEGPAVRAGVEPRYVLRETLATAFYLLTGGSSQLGPAVL